MEGEEPAAADDCCERTPVSQPDRPPADDDAHVLGSVDLDPEPLRPFEALHVAALEPVTVGRIVFPFPPPNFHAAITSAVTTAIPSSVSASTRDSTRRCWRD